MRTLMMAAAAALALAACGQQGTGPQLPPVQAGAQAPTVLTPQPGAPQAAPLTAEQQTQLQTLVTSYLDDVQNQFGQGMGPAQGFTDQVAALQPATDSRWQVALTNGTEYRFIGACDNECSNLDMELIDVRTGGVVASDMLPDDYPVVNFTPSADGQYIVRLIMQTCTVAPCYAGARALTAGAAAANK